MSMSAQPKRECHRAMSSVCTPAEFVMACCSRAASVVFPADGGHTRRSPLHPRTITAADEPDSDHLRATA